MTITFLIEREEKRRFLLDAVESIRDVLVASAEEAEAIRTLPKAAVDAIYDAGLFSMKLPTELGGVEADFVTQIEVIEAVTRIDTSAGWTMMIGSASLGFPIAYLPDDAVAEMFAGGRVPKVTGAPSPLGTAIPENGGFVVNGRWPYASGILHSDWLLAGVAVPNGDGPPTFRVAVLPTSKAVVYDNWNVAGLKGTGSCDFSLSDVFVPNAFTWDLMNVKPVRGGPLYRIGLPGFVTSEHTGFSLGVGRRALDEITELGKTKMRGIPPTPIRERATFQKFLGESELKLRAARAAAIQIHKRSWEIASSGEDVSLEMQLEMRASAAYATDVAKEVVSQAFNYGGASAIYSTNVLQRCYRDISASSQHFMVSSTTYENLGKNMLGMPDINPLA